MRAEGVDCMWCAVVTSGCRRENGCRDRARGVGFGCNRTWVLSQQQKPCSSLAVATAARLDSMLLLLAQPPGDESELHKWRCGLAGGTQYGAWGSEQLVVTSALHLLSCVCCICAEGSSGCPPLLLPPMLHSLSARAVATSQLNGMTSRPLPMLVAAAHAEQPTALHDVLRTEVFHLSLAAAHAVGLLSPL